MSSNAGGKGDAAAGGVHNVWDAVVALIVVGALVVLVVFLVRHYGGETAKVAQVLGIAAPVLAAAFGVSIGYYSGSKTGQATGAKQGKQEMAGRLRPVVDALDEHLDQGIIGPMTVALSSPAGSRSFLTEPGTKLELDQEHVDRSREAIAALRGIVEGAS